MAIYHMSMSNISRGKGQSAIASASYRSGERLYSERYGKTSFYSREVQPVIFILKPEHAPEWALNRERLWNEVEEVETSMNSRLAKEFTLALPIELTNERQQALVKEYVQDNFVDEGMVADVSIHRDTEHNPHAHVMLTNRPFLENGEWGTKSRRELLKDEEGNQLYYPSGDKKSRKISTTNWNDTKTLKQWRQNWAEVANKYLEQDNFTERITDKSYDELGIDKEPTIHEGYVARQMEQDGRVSDRMEHNRTVKQQNYAKQQFRTEHVQQETAQTISNSLSPKEKSRLSSLVKSLGVYVNFDNLLDKTRMVNNWNTKIKFNQVIQPDKDFSNDLAKVEQTKENIQEATNILKDQHLRIFAKYYPDVEENYNLSDYKKIFIAKETLQQDRVLDDDTFSEVLVSAQDHELSDRLREIVSNPTSDQSIQSIQRSLVKTNKTIDTLYEEYGIEDEEDIPSLDKATQERLRKLLSRQDTQYNLLHTLDTYYNERILHEYPTAEIDNLTIRDKEEVVTVMNYYGNRYTFETLLKVADENMPNKYTSFERNIGLSFIYKLEHNTMTKNDYELLEQNPDIKEIYETVKTHKGKQLFLQEYEKNTSKFDKQGAVQEFTSDNRNSISFTRLANNLNIVNTLYNASMDNLMREIEARKEERERKKKRKGKSVKDKKGTQQKGQSIQ